MLPQWLQPAEANVFADAAGRPEAGTPGSLWEPERGVLELSHTGLQTGGTARTRPLVRESVTDLSARSQPKRCKSQMSKRPLLQERVDPATPVQIRAVLG